MHIYIYDGDAPSSPSGLPVIGLLKNFLADIASSWLGMWLGQIAARTGPGCKTSDVVLASLVMAFRKSWSIPPFL